VKITVLSEPGCPNSSVLAERLAEALAGRPEISVSDQVVTSQEDAARLGMRGSPTLLVEGVDPFAEPGQQPSMSCRLYRDDDGRIAPAPSVRQLRWAIEQVTPGK
jgi:hypothetical protein